MLVLLLGGSAATVIPKTAAQPTTVAQPVQLSDEQLEGVQGGINSMCGFCELGFFYWLWDGAQAMCKKYCGPEVIV